MESKEILGLIAALLTIYGHVPYIHQIIKGKTRPHIFSWLMWSLLSAIAFCAQVIKGAGPGAWSTGIVVILALIVTVLSFKRGEKNITRSDWAMFAGCIIALPVWWITKDPTLSIIIVTFIDSLAFGPTLRKSWYKPYEEPVSAYIIHTIRHAVTVSAVVNYSIATAFFPAVMVFMNALTVFILVWRRRAFKTL